MSLRDQLRVNLAGGSSRSLPLIVIVVVLMALLLFVMLAIVPAWRTHQVLSAELDGSARAEQEGRSAADFIEAQMVDLEERLQQAAAGFPSQQEVARLRDRLYEAADASGVTIVTLALQPDETADRAAFALEVTGSTEGLLAFVADLEEAAAAAVDIEDLTLTTGSQAAEEPPEPVDSTTSVLTFTLVAYTADGGGDLTDLTTPISREVPATQNAAAGVDALWQQEDWPAVIALLEAQLITAPEDSHVREQLYQAYVNHGYQLAADGFTAEAEAALDRAVALLEGVDGDSPVESSPAAPPTEAVCDCSGNLYDCADFTTQRDAQTCYEYCGGRFNDVHLLDGDGNGLVCESAFP